VFTIDGTPFQQIVNDDGLVDKQVTFAGGILTPFAVDFKEFGNNASLVTKWSSGTDSTVRRIPNEAFWSTQIIGSVTDVTFEPPTVPIRSEIVLKPTSPATVGDTLTFRV